MKQSVRAHICRVRCSRGAVCGPSWFHPGCTWWQRSGKRCRRSCCRCHKPAEEEEATENQHSTNDFTKKDTSRCIMSVGTCMLKLSLSSGAGGGVLAHTHRAVALIHLAHFALLAVVVHTRICRRGKKLP